MSHDLEAATRSGRSACPEANVLASFLAGLSDEATGAFLEQHLLDCNRCCQTARSLPLDDSLASILDSNSLPVPTGDAEVQAIIERWRRLPDRPRPEIEDTHGVAHALTLPPGFIEPPQAAGELGRLGAYRVLRVLGSGGMGIVLEAEEARLKRRVALKVLNPLLAVHPVQRQRFLREAQAAAAIEHPHIVTIFQVGEVGSIPYLVMQLLKGETLDDRLRRERKLPVPESLRIGRETAEALAEAHARGLIHRDIKPSNIWLEAPHGFVKIVDFGLAQVTDDAQLTHSGAVLGTPAYMSPEQARGDTIDHRSDLFSLGSVLYKLLTGRAAFEGPSTSAVLTALAVDEVKPPSELDPSVPEAVSALVMRLLSKRPEGRFDSARAAAAAIGALEKEVSASIVDKSTLRVTPAPETTASPPRRKPPIVRWAAAACGGLAATVLAAVFLFQSGDGTLRVEINDPNVKVKVDGKNIVLTDADQEPITLVPGALTLTVTRKDFVFHTKQFELKKGEEVTVRVELVDNETVRLLRDGKEIDRMDFAKQPSDVAAAADGLAAPQALSTLAEERSVAEWVAEAGGVVNGVFDRDLVSSICRRVDLVDHPLLTDASLAHFQRCNRLAILAFPPTAITDDGLAALSTVKSLEEIHLSGSKISDDGLKHLAKLPRLEWLGLGSTLVSDEGLLAHVKSMTNLRGLSLTDTAITDAGLPALATLVHLERLELGSNEVTDDGLSHLESLTGLRSLLLRDTFVSEAGIAALARKLPDCWIEASDGKHHLLSDMATERAAVEKLLAMGATGLIAAPESRRVGAPADLPQGPFRVEGIYVHLQQQSGDEGMSLVASLHSPTELMLNDTQISNAGIAKLSGCGSLRLLNLDSHRKLRELPPLELPQLRELRLLGTSVTSAGLKSIGKLTELRTLWLQGTFVDDSGLETIGGLANLELLALSDARITHAGLAHLRPLSRLTSLHLAGSRLSNETMAQLAELRGLEDLDLSDATVSADGLRQLQGLPRLLKLNVTYQQQFHFDDELLDAVADISSLEELLVGGAELTDAGLAHLSKLANLRFLTFHAPKLTDAGIEHLARFSNLRSLDLNTPMVTSAGLAQLAQVENLKRLVLNCPQITDADLAQLGALKHLKILIVGGTTASDAGIAALRAALPDCQITKQ